MKIRAVLLALAVVFSGCSNSDSAREPHVLRIALAGDPNSLIPFLAIDQDVIALDALFCQTLVGLSAENRDVPLLVTRFPTRQNGDISRDGTRITYHLRPAARFADGVPVTSPDVLFTYRAILDARNHATLVEPYKHIRAMETPDAHTVIMRLREPWNAAVRVLFGESDYPYCILPKHAFKDTHIVGTPWESAPFASGPFRVVSWRRGDRIILEANPYFVPKPKLKRIVMHIIADLNSNYVALESGSVDVNDLTPDNVDRASGIHSARVMRFAENGTGMLYLNTQRAPTNDLAVRSAIAHAVDLRELSGAWRNAYPIASGFLPPPIVTWKSPAIPPFNHNIAEANRILDAAGWRMQDGVRVKGNQTLSGIIGANAQNPILVRIATTLQAQLAPIGMRLTVKTNPTTLWYSESGLLRNGNATIAPESWIGGGDPEQSFNLRCVEAVKGGSNHSFYCSKQFEGLFEDQRTAPTEQQRHRDFDEMQSLVRREVPVIPIYYEQYMQGVNTRVVHYERNMLRIPVHPELWDAL